MLQLLPHSLSIMDGRDEIPFGRQGHIGHMDSFREVASGPKLENRWGCFSTSSFLFAQVCNVGDEV
jgi:hypothetical protein